MERKPGSVLFPCIRSPFAGYFPHSFKSFLCLGTLWFSRRVFGSNIRAYVRVAVDSSCLNLVWNLSRCLGLGEKVDRGEGKKCLNLRAARISVLFVSVD